MDSFLVRVYYEDTDCGGIVYHTNFMCFCERARSDLFFQKNKLPLQSEVGFVVKDLKASFLAPAFLGDILEIKTEIKEVKKASLELVQLVYLHDSLEQHRRERQKLFSMEIVLVSLCVKTGRVVKIPQTLFDIFK